MALEATIIGAFPKIGDQPEEQKFRRALHQLDKGEIFEEDLESVIQDVTKDAIAAQVEAGMDLVTDGLIRSQDPLHFLMSQIFGVKVTGLIRYFDTNTFYRQPVIESRCESKKDVYAPLFQFASSNSTKPVRMVMTGPYTLASLSKNEFYREFDQLVFDLAHIVHKEAKVLEDTGCKYIQFDEPAILQNKKDVKLFLKVYEIVTAQLGQIEKTINFNFGSVEGLYPQILDLPVERIGLDLTLGHKNWDVIKSAEFNKKLLAGIVDARNTKLESEQDLVQAVRSLEPQVSLDQIWLSTNHSLEFLPRENAKKKMKLLADVAKQLKGVNVS